MYLEVNGIPYVIGRKERVVCTQIGEAKLFGERIALDLATHK